MSSNLGFAERVITFTITEEFIDSYLKLDRSVLEVKLDVEMERLEDTYSTVAGWRKKKDRFDRNSHYEIVLIPALSADEREVRRGLNSTIHNLSE